MIFLVNAGQIDDQQRTRACVDYRFRREVESAARMRNLVHVSMTRAMDNLQVCTTEEGVEKNAVVGEVLGVTA